MAEAYALKSAKFDLNTSYSIEALYGENDKDYFKAMYIDIVSLTVWDTCKLVTRIYKNFKIYLLQCVILNASGIQKENPQI